MKKPRTEGNSRLPAAHRNSILNLTKLWRGALKGTFWLALVLGLAGQALAQTTVSGSVSGTWTQTGSPYLVVGDVFVGSLVITSNVQVRFQGPYVFEVDGILQAQGTASAPIIFTNANAAVRWNGIFFNESSPNSSLTYCQIYGSTNSGIRIQNTTTAITRCVIANNSAPRYGGGVFALMAGRRLEMVACTVRDNYANPQDLGNGYGGGVYVVGDASFVNSTFSSNVCRGLYWGGVVGGYARGGGIYADNSNITLRNCVVRGNTALTDAGGNDWHERGGGIYLESGTLEIANCVVDHNTCSGPAPAGGGVSVGPIPPLTSATGTVMIVNSAVANNSPEAISVGPGSGAAVTNSILYFNNAGGQQILGNVSATYSDIQGGIQPGLGNISQNPVMDPTTFAVLPGSPCIDAGSPDAAFYDVCFPPSLGLLRNDMGAYGGPGACEWGTDPNAPRIIAQPEPQCGCPGSSVTFSVTATTNAGPLRYQWFRKANSIPGQTAAALNLTSLSTNAAGPYSVMVSNSVAGISTTAFLSMYEACVDLGFVGTNRSLNISGPNGTYVLKYTTNIANTNFATWIPLATNTIAGFNWLYLDTNSTSSQVLFYGVKRLL